MTVGGRSPGNVYERGKGSVPSEEGYVDVPVTGVEEI